MVLFKFCTNYTHMILIIPEKPFHMMNLNELKSFFIQSNHVSKRKRKTKRRYRKKKSQTVKKIY